MNTEQVIRSQCCNEPLVPAREGNTIYKMCTGCGKIIERLLPGTRVDGDTERLSTVETMRIVYGLPAVEPVDYSPIGRTIVEAVTLSQEDLGERGWHDSPTCLKLDDGTILVPMQNPEGEDKGALGIVLRDGRKSFIC